MNSSHQTTVNVCLDILLNTHANTSGRPHCALAYATRRHRPKKTWRSRLVTSISRSPPNTKQSGNNGRRWRTSVLLPVTDAPVIRKKVAGWRRSHCCRMRSVGCRCLRPLRGCRRGALWHTLFLLTKRFEGSLSVTEGLGTKNLTPKIVMTRTGVVTSRCPAVSSQDNLVANLATSVRVLGNRDP